ncbi:unnamed protein product [Thelazia callipaeda]|uniref:WD_REPEATS_REGION domain-containing protein n=1 Tax=Thelazia callipaeda TaxID=103827 RepID=A0A0N5D6C3_THECL|nr:unnamed protein product [Thelazia callipaeda]
MVRSREFGKRGLPYLTHKWSSLYTLDAFTPAERSNLNNRFLPDKSTVDDHCRYELCRCLFLPNGEFIALGSVPPRRTIRVYHRQLTKYSLFKEIYLPGTGPVTDLALSNRGDRIAVATFEAFLLHVPRDKFYEGSRWNTFRAQPPSEIGGLMSLREAYYSLSYSLDDEHIVIAGSYGLITIINTQDYSYSLHRAHISNISSVSCSHINPHIFYSSSTDGFFKIWDKRLLRDDIPVALSSKNDSAISNIDIDDQDMYLVASNHNNVINIWDLRLLNKVQVVNWTSDYSKMVKLWELFEIEFEFITLDNLSAWTVKDLHLFEFFWRVKFSCTRTGQRYVHGGNDLGRISIFDILTGERVKDFTGCSSTVFDSVWNPEENEILGVTVKSAIYLRNNENQVSGLVLLDLKLFDNHQFSLLLNTSIRESQTDLAFEGEVNDPLVGITRSKQVTNLKVEPPSNKELLQVANSSSTLCATLVLLMLVMIIFVFLKICRLASQIRYIHWKKQMADKLSNRTPQVITQHCPYRSQNNAKPKYKRYRKKLSTPSKKLKINLSLSAKFDMKSDELAEVTTTSVPAKSTMILSRKSQQAINEI